jgi:pimeloyl-ACP methyl ester carboxylesterase
LPEAAAFCCGGLFATGQRVPRLRFALLPCPEPRRPTTACSGRNLASLGFAAEACYVSRTGTVIAPVSILLPGLDGTATLFAPFVAAAPAEFPVQPLPLPNDRPRSYRELTDWVLTKLPPEPFALIAESFSGPLALFVADQCPRVTAIVLCASFVQAPLPEILRRLPTIIWTRPPPAALIRFFLTGGDRVLGDAVRSAVASVSADVIAFRIAAALRVDVRPELERFTRPLLVLSAAQDRVIPSRSTRTSRALKPSATFAELQAPHLLLQAQPRNAWLHIKSFLEEASVRAAG